jgi:hypothetical protein
MNASTEHTEEGRSRIGISLMVDVVRIVGPASAIGYPHSAMTGRTPPD